jgi:hypothetical protein
MIDPIDRAPESGPAPETGYAPVNGLQMYYEVHGSGGTPLLLLHGGLFNIDLQFGELLPSLAASRKVIAADFQGHGRTNDIDRPLTSAGLASDVVGVLEHLRVVQVDVFGFSVGGGVALHLAIHHPELVRKLIVSSVSFHPDGDRPENREAVGAMTVDMIAGTPMEQEYQAKSPHPDRLQDLLDKPARSTRASTAGPTPMSRESPRRPSSRSGTATPSTSTTRCGSCSCVGVTSTATSSGSRPPSSRCSRAPPTSSALHVPPWSSTWCRRSWTLRHRRADSIQVRSCRGIRRRAREAVSTLDNRDYVNLPRTRSGRPECREGAVAAPGCPREPV